MPRLYLVGWPKQFNIEHDALRQCGVVLWWGGTEDCFSLLCKVALLRATWIISHTVIKSMASQSDSLCSNLSTACYFHPKQTSSFATWDNSLQTLQVAHVKINGVFKETEDSNNA